MNRDHSPNEGLANSGDVGKQLPQTPSDSGEAWQRMSMGDMLRYVFGNFDKKDYERNRKRIANRIKSGRLKAKPLQCNSGNSKCNGIYEVNLVSLEMVKRVMVHTADRSLS